MEIVGHKNSKMTLSYTFFWMNNENVSEKRNHKTKHTGHKRGLNKVGIKKWKNLPLGMQHPLIKGYITFR